MVHHEQWATCVRGNPDRELAIAARIGSSPMPGRAEGERISDGPVCWPASTGIEEVSQFQPIRTFQPPAFYVGTGTAEFAGVGEVGPGEAIDLNEAGRDRQLALKRVF